MASVFNMITKVLASSCKLSSSSMEVVMDLSSNVVERDAQKFPFHFVYAIWILMVKKVELDHYGK
jgi:hypothetical protein